MCFDLFPWTLAVVSIFAFSFIVKQKRIRSVYLSVKSSWSCLSFFVTYSSKQVYNYVVLRMTDCESGCTVLDGRMLLKRVSVCLAMFNAPQWCAWRQTNKQTKKSMGMMWATGKKVRDSHYYVLHLTFPISTGHNLFICSFFISDRNLIHMSD